MKTDQTSTSTNYDTSSPTYSQSKKKINLVREISKIVKKFIDNALIFEKDFKVSSSDIKELDEIIQKIKTNGGEAKRMHKQLNDCVMNKKISEEKTIRDLVNILETILKDCNKNLPEKIAEIMKSVATKNLNRCCRTLKKLEKHHLAGFTEFDVVLSTHQPIKNRFCYR